MTLLLTTLIILTCVLLVIIVLVQNPKGGGLSSTFGGGGTQLFGGVKKTTDFLDRGTWVLALALVILVMTSNIMLDPNSGAEELRGSALDNVEIADPVPAAGQSFDFPSEVTEEPAATTTEEE
jgi:preprotein translocase subunit SecG